jgi:glycosyltransferase involved in cell wall biosynthesis
MRRRMIEDHIAHVPLSYAVLRAGSQDVAHAWYPTDALAAGRWRDATGRPAVQSYMGIPDFKGLRWKRWRLGITLRSLEVCDVTVALSRYAADSFRHWLGYEAPVIPPPVDVDTFTLADERTEEPTFLCAAALGEWRKRADLLVRAFGRVRRDRPGARLLLNRPRDPATAAQLGAAAEGIELVDMDNRSTLAHLYGTAWVSVLPSLNEAFGLVLAEALACGTPGVGSNQGGIPEVLDRPGTGVLFDGGEEELARALLETAELAGDPRTREICRERALELSTERCTAAYEDLYRSLV